MTGIKRGAAGSPALKDRETKKNDALSSFFPFLWARLGSNQRPSGYEPPALTAELRAPTVFMIINDNPINLQFFMRIGYNVISGLHPAASCQTGSGLRIRIYEG